MGWIQKKKSSSNPQTFGVNEVRRSCNGLKRQISVTINIKTWQTSIHCPLTNIPKCPVVLPSGQTEFSTRNKGHGHHIKLKLVRPRAQANWLKEDFKRHFVFAKKKPTTIWTTREYPGLLRQSLKFREIASSHSECSQNALFQTTEFSFTFEIITQRPRCISKK